MNHEVDIREELTSGEYSGALLTSYGIDFHFFERDVLRALNSIGARTIEIISDAGQYIQSISSAAMPSYAGVRYATRQLGSNWAFHPKVFLLLGPTQGKLIVGSSNISVPGFCRNREIIACVSYDTGDDDQLAGNLLSQAFEFFKKIASRYFPHDDITELNLKRLNYPWLRANPSEDAGETRFVHSLDVSLFDQLQAMRMAETAERIVVFSPFFDRKCRALESIIRGFKPVHLHLIVQEGETSIDGRALEDICVKSSIDLKITNVASASDENRYFHAKGVIVEYEDASVALFGSGNLTINGFLSNASSGGNVEAGLLLSRQSADYFKLFLDEVDSSDLVEGAHLLFAPIEQIEESTKFAASSATALFASYYPDGMLRVGFHVSKAGVNPSSISIYSSDKEVLNLIEFEVTDAGLVEVEIGESGDQVFSEPCVAQIEFSSSVDHGDNTIFLSNSVCVDVVISLQSEAATSDKEQENILKLAALQEENVPDELIEILLRISEQMRVQIDEIYKLNTAREELVQSETEDIADQIEEEQERVARIASYIVEESEVERKRVIRDVMSGRSFSQSILTWIARHFFLLAGGIQVSDVTTDGVEGKVVSPTESDQVEELPALKQHKPTIRKLDSSFKKLIAAYYNATVNQAGNVLVRLLRFWPDIAISTLFVGDAHICSRETCAELAEQILGSAVTLGHSIWDIDEDFFEEHILEIVLDDEGKYVFGTKEVMLAAKLAMVSRSANRGNSETEVHKRMRVRDSLISILDGREIGNIAVDFATLAVTTNEGPLERYLTSLTLSGYEIEVIETLLHWQTQFDIEDRLSKIQCVASVSTTSINIKANPKEGPKPTPLIEMIFKEHSVSEIAKAAFIGFRELTDFKPEIRCYVIECLAPIKNTTHNLIRYRLILNEFKGSLAAGIYFEGQYIDGTMSNVSNISRSTLDEQAIRLVMTEASSKIRIF